MRGNAWDACVGSLCGKSQPKKVVRHTRWLPVWYFKFFGSADVGMHARNTMTTYYVYLLFGNEVADLQSEFCCILKVVVFFLSHV